MNLKNEINRLSHLFNDGVDQMQDTSNDLGQQAKSRANHVAGNAKHALRKGSKQLYSVEEKLLGHTHSNAGIYIATGMLLIGALIAKLLIESRDRQRALPLH